VKKKVLIIVYYWPPSGGGGVQRWLKFVKYLKQTNWEPVLLIPENPDYPILDETLHDEIPADLEIIKVPIFEPFRVLRNILGKKNSGISAGFIRTDSKPSMTEKILAWGRGNLLIPDARKFWISPASKAVIKYLKSNNLDAMVSSGPPHSMHLIAKKIHKKTKLPWLADFRDPWVNMDNADKFQMSAWAKKKHARLERQVLKSATQVDTVSWFLSKQYEQIRGTAVHVLTNGFDHVDFFGKQPVEVDEIVIGHYGTFGDDRNPIALWEALSELVQESELWKNRIKIRLVGPTDNSVLESINSYHLSNYLEYIPYLKHNEVLNLMMQTQILLVILNQNANEEGRVTGKIFEYVATGNQVLGIGSPTSDCAKVIDNSASGKMISFTNKGRIKEALISLQIQGRLSPLNEQVMQYSRQNLTVELVRILDEMTRTEN
jgi:glycosyltransferase involved in cell wall biosynthesis